MSAWGTPEERERKRRIDVAVWAYGYEYESESLVPDDVFDRVSLAIVPEMATGNKRLDNFFRRHFHPDTGMWIRKHPDLDGIRRVYLLKTSGR